MFPELKRATSDLAKSDPPTNQYKSTKQNSIVRPRSVL